MPDKNLLAGFPFFSDVDSKTLEDIAQKGEIFEFNPNDVIFNHDEPATNFYGLLDGEIELTLIFQDKVLKTEIEYEEAIQASMVDQEKQIVVDTVQPGQVFGWASLAGSGRRTVTARCTEPSRIISLPAAQLIDMFEQNHSLGYMIMKRLSDIIAKRLQNRTDKLIEAWVEAFDVGEI